MAAGGGAVFVGYCNSGHIVDEIRVGAARDPSTHVQWKRSDDGHWEAAIPAATLPLIDAERIGPAHMAAFRSAIHPLIQDK